MTLYNAWLCRPIPFDRSKVCTKREYAYWSIKQFWYSRREREAWAYLWLALAMLGLAVCA